MRSSGALGGHLRMPALLAALIIMLAGCTMGTISRAPVGSESARSAPDASRPIRHSPQSVPAIYKVQRGDTLYAIAWRYGLDYREIARWNFIEPPYVIYADEPLVMSDRSLRSRVPTAALPREVRPAGAGKPPVRRLPRPITMRSAPPRPRIRPEWIEARHAGSRAPGTVVTQRKLPPGAKGRSRADSNAPVRVWQWPTRGKVIRSFAQTERNGIDIAGTSGQPVVASADGRVVYSGSGLRGYGALIIVKHNTRFLSAYAHNSRLLVKEGDNVRSGQRIAEMGSTGTDRVKLHFEIRRDGKPVDPRRYLR